MADLDIEVSILAKEMGKDLERAAPQVEAELRAAIENLAHAAYAAMVAKIQSMSMDPLNRKQYLSALKFQDLGDNTYLIYLDGSESTRLEEGFGPYSIKDQLLKSTKTVAVGSRAGQPWVRKSSKGTKYAAVPFEHKPFSGEKSGGDLSQDIKKIMVQNRAGKQQSITEIFRDLGGKPLAGKVAVAGKIEGNPNLSNLTKYQYVGEKGQVSSVYMTYRMVSETSSGWEHPGFKGYQLFKEAKEYVDRELKNVIDQLLE